VADLTSANTADSEEHNNTIRRQASKLPLIIIVIWFRSRTRQRRQRQKPRDSRISTRTFAVIEML